MRQVVWQALPLIQTRADCFSLSSMVFNSKTTESQFFAVVSYKTTYSTTFTAASIFIFCSSTKTCTEVFNCFQ
jgi:hypothetical protein